MYAGQNLDQGRLACAVVAHEGHALAGMDVAGDIGARRPRAGVWGTDTLVCLDGRALGKPADLREAADMIGRLAGRWHEVYSGVCLALPAQGRVACFVEETRVRFHGLTPSEIDAYLRLINPLDKAGGYAAQEHGERIIAGHEGSWSNVLGLPMERLAAVLGTEFGVHPASPGR